jgi:integrase
MGLNLYRRHGRDCSAGHPADTQTYQFEENRKGKDRKPRCVCPIYVSGTLNRGFKRKNTERDQWDEASIVASVWESAESWEADAPAIAARGSVPESTRNRTRLADAITAYLSRNSSHNLSGETYRKYVSFTKQLQEFATNRGLLFIDQFTPSLVDALFQSWVDGPKAKAHKLTKLRSFFQFCINREWLSKSPVPVDLKVVGSSAIKNKYPFTDAELQRIIAACDRIGVVEWQNNLGHGCYSGEDVKDFIWVMCYTGLRISDVCLFNADRIRDDGKVFLFARKNGGDVSTKFPHWLLERIRARVRRSSDGRLFVAGPSTRVPTMTEVWRDKISKAFALAGHFDQRPTPHRFRHTFARILLQAGVPVSDVAVLLGDDERTVVKYYSRWVPELQERLEDHLDRAFGGLNRAFAAAG